MGCSKLLFSEWLGHRAKINLQMWGETLHDALGTNSYPTSHKARWVEGADFACILPAAMSTIWVSQELNSWATVVTHHPHTRRRQKPQWLDLLPGSGQLTHKFKRKPYTHRSNLLQNMHAKSNSEPGAPQLPTSGSGKDQAKTDYLHYYPSGKCR